MAVRAGLRIISNKTKDMQIGYAPADMPVTMSQHQIAEVDNFTGSILTADGDTTHDVQCSFPIPETNTEHQHSLQKSNCKLFCLYAILIPSVIYACETWYLNLPFRRPHYQEFFLDIHHIFWWCRCISQEKNGQGGFKGRG